ncbi:MAG: acyltransferase family protein [Betaproteobacteria bacterium]|nr:acyltransferase family protein [Betaproteobacteria bacterium]
MGVSKPWGEVLACVEEWLSERFEVKRGGGAHNLPAMEGLRGLAVFLVFLVHYVTFIRPFIAGDETVVAVAKAIHVIGNTGVDLFFMLSGYLIYGSLIERRQPFVRFMRRRAQRIYPAFLAVFLVYLMLSVGFPTESKIPSSVLGGLLYVVENLLLLPGLFPIPPMITVAWSLSYEVFFYIAIPILIAVLSLRSRTTSWRIAAFGLIALLFTCYCYVWGGPIRMLMFVAGIFVYESIKSDALKWLGSSEAFILAIGGMAVSLLPLSGAIGTVTKVLALCIAFYACGLACIGRPAGWLPRSMSWKPVRWLGNMSYSYYLLHGLTLKACFLLLGGLVPMSLKGSWLFWVLLPPMFCLTLAPTAALYLTVERPFSLSPSRRRLVEPAS